VPRLDVKNRFAGKPPRAHALQRAHTTYQSVVLGIPQSPLMGYYPLTTTRRHSDFDRDGNTRLRVAGGEI